MRKLRMFCWASMLSALGMSSNADAQPCTLASLNWMAGNWLNADAPAKAQERWAVAPDDVLMGSSWEFTGSQSGYAEIMTVRSEGSGLVMVLRHFDAGLAKAWEERDAPMIFTVSRCEPNAAVFDGDGAHASEHLSYRRSGNKLLITGDFLHHGQPDHEEWHMVSSGD